MTAAPDFAPLFPPERLPPANIEAEQSLLAAILANNSTFEQVADFLMAEHFADPAHGRIYDACRAMIEAGQTASAITLKNRFDQDEELASEGGARYLAGLQTSFVSLDAGHYGRIVHDCALRRGAMRIAEDLSERAARFDYDLSAPAVIEAASEALFRLQDSGGTEGDLRPASDGMFEWLARVERAMEAPGRITGLSTGIHAIDQALSGINAPHLVILAARPGQFKTALALQFARAAAKAGAPAAFFSLEMGADELAGRIAAAEAGVSYDAQSRGEIDGWQFEAVRKAAEAVRDWPLMLDGTPGLTLGRLRTRCRRMKQRHGLALVIVDYLQLMTPPKAENRTQEISQITRGLKLVAKELGVPIVALSQLSRNVEQREDKRPNLSDLRESGSIEQDADIVMFNYWEAKYIRAKKPRPKFDGDDFAHRDEMGKWAAALAAAEKRLDVIVAKNRHGPERSIEVGLDPALMRFFDVDAPEDCR